VPHRLLHLWQSPPEYIGHLEQKDLLSSIWTRSRNRNLKILISLKLITLVHNEINWHYWLKKKLDNYQLCNLRFIIKIRLQAKPAYSGCGWVEIGRVKTLFKKSPFLWSPFLISHQKSFYVYWSLVNWYTIRNFTGGDVSFVKVASHLWRTK
jgi:hypothetical protein